MYVSSGTQECERDGGRGRKGGRGRRGGKGREGGRHNTLKEVKYNSDSPSFRIYLVRRRHSGFFTYYLLYD